MTNSEKILLTAVGGLVVAGGACVGGGVAVAVGSEMIQRLRSEDAAKLARVSDLPKAPDTLPGSTPTPVKKVGYATTPVPTPTETSEPTDNPIVTPTSKPAVKPTVRPTATTTSGLPTCDQDRVTDESDSTPMFTVRGFPKKVNKEDVILPPFKQTLNEITGGVIGEPGTLLLAKDAPQSEVDATGGSGERITPGVNQFSIDKKAGTIGFQSGQIIVDSFQEGRITLEDKTLVLRERPDNRWIVVGKTEGTGEKRIQSLDCLVPAHNQENLLLPGYGMSKGSFEEAVDKAFKTGAKTVSVLVFNEEDGTWGVMIKRDPKADWEILPGGSNWLGK